MAKRMSVYGAGGTPRHVSKFGIYGAGGTLRNVKAAWVYGAGGTPRQFFSAGAAFPLTLNAAVGPGNYNGYSIPPLADTFGSIVPSNFSMAGFQLTGLLTNKSISQVIVYFSVPSGIDPGKLNVFSNFYTGIVANPVLTAAAATYNFVTINNQAQWQWSVGAKYTAGTFTAGFDAP